MQHLSRVVFLIFSLSLVACATHAAAAIDQAGPAPATTPVSPATALPPTATAPPTQTPVPPTASATSTRVIRTATPSPTPGCAEAQGAVAQISVPSDTLNYPIDARIYVPPCYAASDARYPVLYLIHGLNFTEDQWERLGAPTAADDLIARGEVAPLIIVMPRDRRDARLDPAFVNDLVPHIDAHYRTLPDRGYRAIGGLSRGAGWALHLGLHYPEVFGRIGAHSPAVFFGDEQQIIDWTHHLPADRVPAIYFDIGEGDAGRRSAVWLDQVFTWFKVEHTYILRPGAHSEKYWSAHVAEYLLFYAAGWQAAVAAPSPPSP
jgi:enterochelin esterase-like enzyme